MSAIQRAIDLHSAIHNKGWASQTPNTETEGHAQDHPSVAKVGVTGNHRNSNHLVQDIKWEDLPFTYKWNSLGLRGPEPDFSALRKLMVVGNSMTIGQGVPLEDTWVHLLAQDLNMDYINLSEYFVLTDSLERLSELAHYEPNILIICTGRFFTGLDMMAGYATRNLDKDKDSVIIENSMAVIRNTNKTLMQTFELAVKQLYPKTKIFWMTNERTINERHQFKRMRDPFAGTEVWQNISSPVIEIEPKKDYVDLARDNIHGGPRSHKIVKDKILNVIQSTTF